MMARYKHHNLKSFSRWLIPLPAVLFAFFPLKASAELDQRTWTCSQSSTIRWTMQQPLADYQAGLRPNWSDCLAWQNGEPANYVWSYGASVTTTTTSTTTTTLPATSTSTSSMTTTSEPIATTTTTQQPNTTTTQLATTSTSTLPQETSTTTTTTQPATTTTSSTTTTEVQTPPQTTTTTSTSTTTTSSTTTTLPLTTTTAISTTEMPRSETVRTTEPPTTTTTTQTTTTQTPTTTTELATTTTVQESTSTSLPMRETTTTRPTSTTTKPTTSQPPTTRPTTTAEAPNNITTPTATTTTTSDTKPIAEPNTEQVLDLFNSSTSNLENTNLVQALNTVTDDQVDTVVGALLAQDSGATDQQALSLASSPQILENVDSDQADAIFEAVDESALTAAEGQAIVDAVSKAPDKVKSSFQAKINIFSGVFDDYVPLGSTVPVGVRRAMVAAGGTLTIIAAGRRVR